MIQLILMCSLDSIKFLVSKKKYQYVFNAKTFSCIGSYHGFPIDKNDF
jgi:hypothetical protein